MYWSWLDQCNRLVPQSVACSQFNEAQQWLYMPVAVLMAPVLYKPVKKKQTVVNLELATLLNTDTEWTFYLHHEHPPPERWACCTLSTLKACLSVWGTFIALQLRGVCSLGLHKKHFILKWEYICNKYACILQIFCQGNVIFFPQVCEI